MTYEQQDMGIAPIVTSPAITLDQWLSKRDAWLESTESLVCLWFENELGTRAELARHLGMAKSTITHHCNKLIEAGFTVIPSSKGQGKRRDLQKLALVQEAEVIDVSSTIELPQPRVELRLSKAEELLAEAKARKEAADKSWEELRDSKSLSLKSSQADNYMRAFVVAHELATSFFDDVTRFDKEDAALIRQKLVDLANEIGDRF